MSLVFSTWRSLHGVLSKPSISTILTCFTEDGTLVKSNSFSASLLCRMYLLTRRFFPINALISSCSCVWLIFLRSVLAEISIFPLFSVNLEIMKVASGNFRSMVLARMCSAV